MHEVVGWSGPMTHRQYAAWHEWLEGPNLEKPSRDNYYIMQLTAEVKGLFSKVSIDVNELKLKFKKPIDLENLPPDDPTGFGPKRLRTKEDVEKARNKINLAMAKYQMGMLKES